MAKDNPFNDNPFGSKPGRDPYPVSSATSLCCSVELGTLSELVCPRICQAEFAELQITVQVLPPLDVSWHQTVFVQWTC